MCLYGSGRKDVPPCRKKRGKKTFSFFEEEVRETHLLNFVETVHRSFRKYEPLKVEQNVYHEWRLTFLKMRQSPLIFFDKKEIQSFI
jgi:hypothetical protein